MIASARLTSSTDVAVEAVATAPGTEARRTLALAATGIPAFLAGLAYSVVLVVVAQVRSAWPRRSGGSARCPTGRCGASCCMCPAACLGGAVLGVLTGRWLRFRGASAMAVVALIVVSLLGQAPLLETSSSEWRLWVPWAIFHTGDNADGTQTLIAGNPAAYLGYMLALCVLAVLGAMWHDRTARTPRFRALVGAVAATALVLFAVAATTGNHDNRDSDPIPSRVTG